MVFPTVLYMCRAVTKGTLSQDYILVKKICLYETVQFFKTKSEFCWEYSYYVYIGSYVHIYTPN